MRIPRIYTQENLVIGSVLQLDAIASGHIARVLRLKAGDQIKLFNGDNSEYLAEIITADKKSVSIRVHSAEVKNRESSLITRLGLVMSKGDRFDYAIQKATELGVYEITPLTSERCEVSLKGERAEKKRAHWQAIAVAACEQCQRNRIPRINPAMSLANWLAINRTGLNLVLHHRAAMPMQSFEKPESVNLLIGPEGGLSESEIDLAQRHNFQSSLMGPRVLRTETAPIVALTAAQLLWGDFQRS